MKAKIPSKEIASFITMIKNLHKDENLNTFNFSFDKKESKLTITAAMDYFSVRRTLPLEECKKSFEVSIAGDVAANILAIKKDLYITVKDNHRIMLSSEDKNFNSTIYAIAPDKVKRKKPKDIIKLEKDLCKKVFSLLFKTMLIPTYEDEPILTNIVIENNTVYLTSSDNYHASFITFEHEHPDLSIIIPTVYIMQLNRIIDKSQKRFEISVTDTQIFINTDDTELVLPIVGIEYNNFNTVKNNIESLSNPSSETNVNSNDIKEKISSFNSLHNSTEVNEFSITMQKDKVELLLKNKDGTVKETITNKTTNKDQIHLDFQSFKDVIIKTVGMINLTLYDKKMCTLTFEKDKVNYLYLISGRAAEE